MPSEPADSSGTLVASGTVPSPCVSVCRIDPSTGWCEGCGRTIEEIAHWSVLDDEDKRAIWSDLARRRRGHR